MVQTDGSEAFERKEKFDATFLEKLESAKLNPTLKKELLLVFLNERPATQIVFRSDEWVAGEEPKPVNLDSFDQLMDCLNNSALAYEVSEDETVNPIEYLLKGTEGESMRRWKPNYDFDSDIAEGRKELRKVVSIGRDEDGLELIKQAYKENNARLFGRAYGFPETAIDAYENNDILTPEEVAKLANDPDIAVFAGMAFSKDHWQEESQIVQKKIAAVKSASPKIWDQLVQ